MHEDAIATIREEKRHRLILTIALRSLRVGDGEMYLLSHLIQRSERLATSIDAFTRSYCKDGINAAGVVRATFDKRERQQFYLG